MLVGRDSELKELSILRERAGRSCVIALIQGPDGVGKTALALEVTAPATTIRINNYPGDAEVPLSGVRDLAQQLGVELGTDPAQDLFSALENAPPTCLLIDDAQHMDVTSQVLLWRVLRRARPLPILVLVTCSTTSGQLLEALTLLLRDPTRGRILTLAPLTEAQVATFLRRHLRVPVTGRTLSAVHANTGGYPGPLTALVDQIPTTHHALTIPVALRAFTATTPVGEAEQRRVRMAWQKLDDAVRAALVAVAHADELSIEEIARSNQLLGLPEVPLAPVLDTGLVDRRSGGLLRLRHRQTQQAILDQVPPSEARQVHAALAQTLDGQRSLKHRVAAADETARGPLLEELGALYSTASLHGEFQAARGYAQLASRLDPAWAVEAVLSTFRTGLKPPLNGDEVLVREMPPSVARTAVLTLIEMRDGGAEAAAHRLRGLLDVEITDARDLIVLANAVFHVIGDATMNTSSHVAEQFRPLVDLLRRRAATEPPQVAFELLINAIGLELVVDHMLNPSLPLSERIESVEALRASLQEPAIRTQLETVFRSVLGLLNFAIGRWEEARRHTQDLSIRTLPLLEAQVSLMRVLAAFHHGDWDEAHRIADRQLATTLDELQEQYWRQAFAVAALVPAARGEQSVAERYLSWDGQPHVVSVADACHSLAMAWRIVAQRQDPAPLAPLLDGVWEAGLVNYGSAATTAVLRVKGHLATADVESARRCLGDLDEQPYEPHAKGYTHAHAAALVAAAEGRIFDAIDHFTSAREHLSDQVDANPNAGLRLHHALLIGDLVEFYLGVRRREAARQLLADLEAAEHLLTSCGATPWAEHLASLKEEIAPEGPESPPPAASLLSSLTPREREIALLAARGLTNREIAAELFVTVRTAEFHVHNALRKMGLTSRRQLRTALQEDGAATS